MTSRAQLSNWWLSIRESNNQTIREISTCTHVWSVVESITLYSLSHVSRAPGLASSSSQSLMYVCSTSDQTVPLCLHLWEYVMSRQLPPLLWRHHAPPLLSFSRKNLRIILAWTRVMHHTSSSVINTWLASTAVISFLQHQCITLTEQHEIIHTKLKFLFSF